MVTFFTYHYLRHICTRWCSAECILPPSHVVSGSIHLTALCPGLPRWAGTRKVKPILILLKQETVSGIGISWAICKSAPCSRLTTMPAPHHSVFYRPSCRPTNSVKALKAHCCFFFTGRMPSCHPTTSMHWRHIVSGKQQLIPTLTLQNSNQLFFWRSLHIPQISQKSTHDFLSYPVIQAAEKQVAVKITSAATSSNRSNTF